MLANILVLGVLSASAYLIYLVVKRSDEREKGGKPPTVLEQYEVRFIQNKDQRCSKQYLYSRSEVFIPHRIEIGRRCGKPESCE